MRERNTGAETGNKNGRPGEEAVGIRNTNSITDIYSRAAVHSERRKTERESCG